VSGSKVTIPSFNRTLAQWANPYMKLYRGKYDKVNKIIKEIIEQKKLMNPFNEANKVYTNLMEEHQTAIKVFGDESECTTNLNGSMMKWLNYYNILLIKITQFKMKNIPPTIWAVKVSDTTKYIYAMDAGAADADADKAQFIINIKDINGNAVSGIIDYKSTDRNSEKYISGNNVIFNYVNRENEQYKYIVSDITGFEKGMFGKMKVPELAKLPENSSRSSSVRVKIIEIKQLMDSQEEEGEEQDAKIASAKSGSTGKTTNWGPGFITLEEASGRHQQQQHQ